MELQESELTKDSSCDAGPCVKKRYSVRPSICPSAFSSNFESKSKLTERSTRPFKEETQTQF